MMLPFAEPMLCVRLQVSRNQSKTTLNYKNSFYSKLFHESSEVGFMFLSNFLLMKKLRLSEIMCLSASRNRR